MEKHAASEHSTDLSLEGLEEVFVHTEQLSKSEQLANISNSSEHIHDFDAESAELLPMAEASRRLKIPYPTLRRKVLSGKIASVKSPDGKILVRMAVSENSPKIHEQRENKPEQSAIKSESSLTIHRLLLQIETEREYSRTLNERLEAANHRNGYLEAQIGHKDEQIKLLTQRTDGGSWWALVRSWFSWQER